jgi:carboxymethylenebutenolidase
MCLGDGCDLEEYDRRTFLAGGAAAVAALAAGDAPAQEKKPPVTRVLDDPDVERGRVFFPSGGKEIDGFLARPKAAGKYPAVLVIAGNRITEEYIPNTCAALAKAGFVGLAPNIFHPVPDSARTLDAINKALEGHTDEHFLKDIVAGAEYLHASEHVRPGGLGVVGFCSGGRRALLLAARPGDVKAVVAYHPAPMKPEELRGLKAPVQVHHGTADRPVPVAHARELEKMLRAQGTAVELHIYEKADHGFLAYTRPYYDPGAAVTSWERAVSFLRRHLK